MAIYLTEWQIANENIGGIRFHRNSCRVPIQARDISIFAELIDVNGGLLTAFSVVFSANIDRIRPHRTRF